MAKRKQKNALVRYLTPFGLKQIGDIILILLAPIITILGMALFSITPYILPVGLGLFMLGGSIAVFRSIMVALTTKNKRSPEFKRSVVNIVIMGLVIILAIIGMVHFFTVQII
ncbi:MAG: hypothetical protein FWE03_01060 [Firmicutes bacterium]|nr:hypothetical protein [Bacillota bacterium]